MDSTSAQSRGDSFAGAAGADSVQGVDARRASTFEESASSQQGGATGKGPAAVDRAWEDLRAMRVSLALLLAARRDQIKLALRRALFWAIAIGLSVFAAAVFATTACVMVVIGIAGGVTELVGGRLWLGQLLTGLVFVLSAGLLGFLLIRIARQRFRRQTLERYGKVER